VPEPCLWIEDAVANEVLHRFAHRDARYLNLQRQIALRGQRVAGLDDAAGDGILDPALELQVERPALRQNNRIGGEKHMAGVGHLSV
jgi:hypothetical protein